MKRIITILLFFWASGVFAQDDVCSNTPTINFTSVNQSVISTNLLSATVSDGEFLPLNVVRNQPVTKSIFFKISLPYPRKITFEVKPTNANSLKTDHVGFAIYQANACNLNTSTLIYSNVGIGSYESSDDLAAGTYYVQVFCNNSFDSEVVLNLKKYVYPNNENQAANLPVNQYFCIETNNLVEISNPNYPTYTKSFWAKIEIPVGKYAMPLRFKAWNMNTVAKVILRKNSPTAAPLANLDLPTNGLYSEGICSLGEGTYYLEVLLKPDALGLFCLQNEAIIENTNLIKGTNFSNAIGLENQEAKNIKISCNPIDIPQAVCEGQPNFYLKQSFTTINIPSNGSINYQIWADNAKFQLFSANQIALSFCIDIQNYANLQFCNLSAGTYYAKLSFQTTTQEYSITARFESEILGDKKNNPITINTTGNFGYGYSIPTKCLTLDANENTFSATYGKSFWTKIIVPTAYYGNPIKIALNAGSGYNNTNGKTLVRMFDNNGNIVQNNAHLDMVTSNQVNLEATYCSIEAGTYWVQVLVEDAADFVVSLSISGNITTTRNQYTLGSPKDFGVSDNQSLAFEDNLACSKTVGGVHECALPKCSTFLKWTINSPQVLSVRLNPENNPDSLKFIVWKKDVLPCQYISFLTSCGNSTAVLDAGTYMMQVYTNAPLQNPLLAMLTVTLSSLATSEGNFTSIGFTSVDVGDENLTIGTLIFDGTPTFVSPSTSNGLPNGTNPTPLTNFGLACEETTNNPCSPTEVRAVGFELLQESFVKLIYDARFKTKLYRAESLVDLVESNLVYGCGDSTYFCSLQPDKYILVLYSAFLNTTKTVKISAWQNGVSNAPSLALAPNNDFGANPQNSIKTDKIYCTTQRNENDNLPTTNASRHVWFTWKTTQAGNFTVNGGNYQYGDDGLRFYLYYTDQEDFMTSNLVYLNEYNVNHHTFTSPCQNRRYYLKAVGKPNQTVSLNVNFVPNLNTQQGNYMSNAYALDFATTGSFTSVTQDISCHDLSPATDYREGDNTDAFTQGLSNFKSTWFKIYNTAPYNINMSLRLQHNLSNFGFVRYRILKANSTGTNIISEGTTVTNINSIINLECFNDAYYYVQVLTNREAQGTLTLQATVNNNTGVCPPRGLCAVSNTTRWTGSVNNDWFNYQNWTAGVPDINTDTYIPNAVLGTNPTPNNIPFISANKTAFVANIFVERGLVLEGILKLNHHFVNQSQQTNFGGKVLFVGCQTQFISGNMATFENIEVDNLQNLEIKTEVIFSKTLTLTNGNVLANGLLTLLSNATQTAMIIQKDDASNQVIGNMTVQRHLGGRYQDISYKLVGSPVQNATLQGVFAQKMNLVLNTNYNQGNSPYTRPYPTVFYYDESQAGFSQNNNHPFTMGWKSSHHVFENMIPQKGYMANIHTHRVLDFVGNPNNGFFESNVTNGQSGLSRGWNFVANPYPSPIFWNKVLALSQNIAPTVYMQIATSQYENNWGYYNANTEVSIDGVGNEIALGQGFFVYVGQNTGKVVMDNTVRLKTYRNVANTFRKESLPKLKFAFSNGHLSDETDIVFGQNASPDFEENIDIPKLNNFVLMPLSIPQIPHKENYINIFTQSPQENLALNAVGNLEKDLEIPLKVEAMQAGNYELKVSEMNIPSGFSAYLFEPNTQKTTLLDNKTKLTVALQSNQSKSFVVKFVKKENEFESNELVIYPNPVENELKIRWNNAYEGQADFRVFDTNGKQIWSWKQELRKNQVLNLQPSVSQLASGVYHLQIKTDSQVFVKKFTKK